MTERHGVEGIVLLLLLLLPSWLPPLIKLEYANSVCCQNCLNACTHTVIKCPHCGVLQFVIVVACCTCTHVVPVCMLHLCTEMLRLALHIYAACCVHLHAAPVHTDAKAQQLQIHMLCLFACCTCRDAKARRVQVLKPLLCLFACCTCKHAGIVCILHLQRCQDTAAASSETPCAGMPCAI